MNNIDRNASDSGRTVHSVFDTDHTNTIESSYLHGREEDGGESVVIAREGVDGRTATVHADAGRDVVGYIEGPASDRQARELRAAQGLVDRLNQDGAYHWGDVKWLLADSRLERGIDCVADGPDGAVLNIQVTMTEGQLWGRLARAASVRRSRVLGDVVEAIWAAIDAHRNTSGRDILLALDATDCPDTALLQVVAAFREKYLQRASAAGWQEIWVVGPVVDLVQRLDVE